MQRSFSQDASGSKKAVHETLIPSRNWVEKDPNRIETLTITFP
jgi:hypothetical protein